MNIEENGMIICKENYQCKGMRDLEQHRERERETTA
jgi:hypothetical protein